jgi:hypothetical protein
MAGAVKDDDAQLIVGMFEQFIGCTLLVKQLMRHSHRIANKVDRRRQ